MKIVTVSGVFLQKIDIVYLNQSNIQIPKSIKSSIDISTINDNNRYEFVEFKSNEEIQFLKNVNWLVNYNDVKDLSEDEIMNLWKEVEIQKKQLLSDYLSIPKDDIESHMDLMEQSKCLEFKAESLKEFLWFVQGHVKVKLPAGIDYPKHYTKNGIQKVFKRIFNK